VGNLAYHYANKLAIVQVIDELLKTEIEPILSDKKEFSMLLDFDTQLSHYYFLINKYAFYFLDLLEMERSYPNLYIQRQQYIYKMINQIYNWLQSRVETHIIKAEIHEGQYQNTAQTIWMIVTFWLTQQKVRGRSGEDEGAFKEVVWNQIVPLFTTNGMMEYEALILPQLKHFSKV